MKQLVLVDGPNSTDVNLDKLVRRVYSMNRNTKLCFFSNNNVYKGHEEKALVLGFDVFHTGRKDVDAKILSYLDELYDLKNPPEQIFLVSGDGDYIDKIKRINSDLGTKFIIVLGTNHKKLAAHYRLMDIDIVYLSRSNSLAPRSIFSSKL